MRAGERRLACVIPPFYFLCLQTLFRASLFLFICSQAGEGGTSCLTKKEKSSKMSKMSDFLGQEQLKYLSFLLSCLLWFLCQMAETCHFPREQDISFFSLFFSFVFYLPSSDSCRERPGWHKLGGFQWHTICI